MKALIFGFAMFAPGAMAAATAAKATVQRPAPAVRPAALDEELEQAMAAAQTDDASQSSEEILDGELKTEAKATVLGSAKSDPATPAVAEAKSEEKANLKESEIPVLVKSDKKSSDESSPIWRMLISFAIIGGAGTGLYFFGKWWGRNHRRNDLNTQIRVMSQHFLGPRKSLAIVRVAGEYILLGVTDHSISMLKTLSLIDDEYPEETPARYADALNKNQFELELGAGASATEKNDDFSFGNVKEVISNRLRQMRTLE